MNIRNFFKRKPKPIRETGYYWIQYSYGGERTWRIAWYNEAFGFWQLDGETRPFHDQDFLSIDPRPIPGRPIVRLDNLDYLAFITWMVLLSIYIIIKLTSITI